MRLGGALSAVPGACPALVCCSAEEVNLNQGDRSLDAKRMEYSEKWARPIRDSLDIREIPW